MYEYNARVVRVIDGDTLVLDIDLGIRIHTTQVVRLLGVNAPEMVGEQRAAGLASRKWLGEQLPEGTRVRVKTYLDKKDKYGRLLAEVFLDDSTFLNQAIIDNGYGEKA